MADFSFTLTVDDAKVSSFINSLHYKYGEVDDGAGGSRPRTNAELKEAVKQEVLQMLKKNYRTYLALSEDNDPGVA